MRIDAHQHFWRYAPETHGWIDDSMAVLKRDFLPEDLAPLLAAAEFDGSVVVQAQMDVAETEWLLSLAEGAQPRTAVPRASDSDLDAQPGTAVPRECILGVVGWVDLTSDRVEEQLQMLAAHPGLVGVRHVVQSEPDGFMAREDFRRGVGLLEQHGLAYDVLIYERQLPEAVEFVRAFPRQRFVIDHIAKPDIRNRSFESWARGMRAIAAFDNVWCKLSGMVTEGAWAGWGAADFEPYIETVLEAFGARRCMIGSDWPVCTLAGSYGEVVGIVRGYVARLSEAEREAVMGGTAVEFYGLG